MTTSLLPVYALAPLAFGIILLVINCETYLPCRISAVVTHRECSRDSSSLPPPGSTVGQPFIRRASGAIGACRGLCGAGASGTSSASWRSSRPRLCHGDLSLSYYSTFIENNAPGQAMTMRLWIVQHLKHDDMFGVKDSLRFRSWFQSNVARSYYYSYHRIRFSTITFYVYLMSISASFAAYYKSFGVLVYD